MKIKSLVERTPNRLVLFWFMLVSLGCLYCTQLDTEMSTDRLPEVDQIEPTMQDMVSSSTDLEGKASSSTSVSCTMNVPREC